MRAELNDLITRRMETAMVDADMAPSRRYLSLCPETDLVLAALTAPWRQESRQRVAGLINDPLDWDCVQSIADAWRVQPLLYETLRLLRHPRTPSHVLEMLAIQHRTNSQHNLQMVAECLRLVALFRQHGISAVPYKGPFLASLLYPNLSVRRLGDLDFLLRRDEIDKAVQLLLSQGFRPQNPNKPIDSKSLFSKIRNYEVSLYSRDGSLMVELHWSIIPPASLFRLEPDFFWNWLRPFRLLGVEVSLFPPEEQFFILCLHNEKHSWRSVRPLVDIVRMLDVYPNLNWQRAHDICQQFRRYEAVDVTLRLIQDILGVAVPEGAWTGRLSPERLAHRAALIRSLIFRPAFSFPGYAEWSRCLERARLINGGGRFRPARPTLLGYARALLVHETEDQCHVSPSLRHWPIFYSIVRVLRQIKYQVYGRFRWPAVSA